MGKTYALCWTRRRVWLVGPFAGPDALAAWGRYGVRANKNDDPRWNSIEPDAFTLRTVKTYAPSDKRGFLHGAGWESE